MFHLSDLSDFEVMSLRLNPGSQPCPPLFNSFVNDTLLQLCPHNDEVLLQLVDVPYCCLVDAFLYWTPKFCSQLDYGLVSLLARVPVQ